MKIGDNELTCAVLEDGSRIISRNAIFKAFGRTKRGRKKGEVRVIDVPDLPSFIDAQNLQPYIDENLMNLLRKKLHIKVETASQSKDIPLKLYLYCVTYICLPD